MLLRGQDIQISHTGKALEFDSREEMLAAEEESFEKILLKK